MIFRRKTITSIICIGLTFSIVIGLKFLNVSVSEKRAKYQIKISECQALINLMDKEASVLRKENVRYHDGRRSMKKCNLINLHQMKLSEILAAIIHNMPQTIWLKKFTIKEKKPEPILLKISTRTGFKTQKQYHAEIHGRSASSESAEVFAEMLMNSGIFQNIFVKENCNIDFAWQFTIKCDLVQW